MSAPNPAVNTQRLSNTDAPRRRQFEHYDTTPLRKVSSNQWRSVWQEFGLGELPEDDAAVADTVAARLTGPERPAFSHGLLQALYDFGTALGAHVLHEAGVAVGVDRSDWPEQVEDLAVELWLRGRQHELFQRVLVVAEVAIHERDTEKSSREYFGEVTPGVRPTKRQLRAFRDDVSEWFKADGCGPTVNLKLSAEDDRTVICVYHGGRFRREVAVDDIGRESLLGFRPLACDVISHEPATGALRIYARSKRAANLYRRALGRTLFNDAEFFGERPLYGLGPIADALTTGSLPPWPTGWGIQSVTLVDCRWVDGEGIQYTVHGLRGRDCATNANAGFDPDTMDVTRATLNFRFLEDGRIHRVTAVLREGNHLRCSRANYREAVDAYLVTIGAKRQANAATTGPMPMRWSGIQSVARWQDLLGDDLIAAVDTETLVKRDRPRVVPGETRALGTVPTFAVETQQADLVIACDGDELAVVDATELAGYELNEARLAQEVALDIGCQRSVAALPIPGAYFLGPLLIGSVRIRPYLLTRPVPDSTAVERTLHEMAGGDEWLTIHMPSAALDRWTRAVPIPRLIRPLGLRRSIIYLLRLEHQVLGPELANGQRLVLDGRDRVAWFDEKRLDLADGEFATLWSLAAAYERQKPVAALDLAGASGTPEAGRKRVSALRRALRLRSDDDDLSEVVANARKSEGYVLKCEPYLILPQRSGEGDRVS